ncbi:MAG: ABC transporter ATP-binding protein [Vulcanimicrobiaceae bacterium]
MSVPRLRLSGIRKAYPAVVANDGIELTVMPGEIHAILGENGAGKSTLMKIISGVIRPDEGEIFWEGRPVSIANPALARMLGIGMVFQHFSLFETLTVAENVALSVQGSWRGPALAARIGELSQRYGLPLDPERLVHSLSVGECQRLEIVRCLLDEPKLLIMDEPTSVLAPQAVERLFVTLRRLAAEGCSILYISHKLDEIKALCHSATVLSAGRVTGSCDPSKETSESLARMMIGRDLPVVEHPAPARNGEVRLALAGLSRVAHDSFGTDLKDISLYVRAGEIVGIAGASGNGQRELLETISGEDPFERAGAVAVCGVDAGQLGPAQRRALGMAFVPADRLGRAVVASLSLAENALLTADGEGMVRRGFILFDAVQRFAERCIERFGVKCAGPSAQAKSLSGGNLQKFIVGREILHEPKLLVVSHPTWGVDVNASAFIRRALIELRNAGAGLLVVSDELDELFELCDRIAVISAGRLSPAKPVVETSVEEIGLWMSGLWPASKVSRVA